jgi:hypothetical protein
VEVGRGAKSSDTDEELEKRTWTRRAEVIERAAQRQLQRRHRCVLAFSSLHLVSSTLLRHRYWLRLRMGAGTSHAQTASPQSTPSTPFEFCRVWIRNVGCYSVVRQTIIVSGHRSQARRYIRHQDEYKQALRVACRRESSSLPTVPSPTTAHHCLLISA